MLNQPYPLSDVTPRSVWGAVLAGLFVSGFLLFFQPFNLDQWSDPYKWLKIAGYGVITTLVLCVDFYVIKQPWKVIFDEKKWTVWKEIVWTLFILLSVTAGNYIYTVLIFSGKHLYYPTFWGMVLATFSVGIFPAAAFVLINYIIQLRKYMQPVAVHHSLPATTLLPTLELVAENGKDRLTLRPEELLYIESSDNYATIYFLANHTPVKELIRSSLTRLEGQLSHPEVVRCHRSYIVNLMHVERVSGNAQGYKLHLKNLETPVPVARKYAPVILEKK